MAYDYRRLDTEAPNIELTFTWCDENGHHEEAARLLVDLEDYCIARAGWGPLTERASTLLAKAGLERRTRALLHVTLARVAFRRGDYDALEVSVDAAEKEAKTDPLVRARVGFMRAALCRKRKEFRRSRAYCMVSLDALGPRDHLYDQAVARYNLGAAFDEDPDGDWIQAIEHFRNCEAIFTDLGAHHRGARCSLRRLSLELRLGRHDDPESAIRELSDRFVRFPRELILLKLLDADHHERLGDLRTAAELFEAAAIQAGKYGAAPEYERARSAFHRLEKRDPTS